MGGLPTALIVIGTVILSIGLIVGIAFLVYFLQRKILGKSLTYCPSEGKSSEARLEESLDQQGFRRTVKHANGSFNYLYGYFATIDFSYVFHALNMPYNREQNIRSIKEEIKTNPLSSLMISIYNFMFGNWVGRCLMFAENASGGALMAAVFELMVWVPNNCYLRQFGSALASACGVLDQSQRFLENMTALNHCLKHGDPRTRHVIILGLNTVYIDKTGYDVNEARVAEVRSLIAKQIDIASLLLCVDVSPHLYELYEMIIKFRGLDGNTIPHSDAILEDILAQGLGNIYLSYLLSPTKRNRGLTCPAQLVQSVADNLIETPYIAPVVDCLWSETVKRKVNDSVQLIAKALASLPPGIELKETKKLLKI